MLNANANRKPLSGRVRAALSAALLCVAVPVAGAAIQADSAIGGTVRDPSGLVLSNATVRLSQAGSEKVVETTTDATGQFRFSGAGAGEYTLTARSNGFASLRHSLHIVGRGAVDLSLTLQVGTLQETITVTSGPSTSARNDRADSTPLSPPAPACTASATGGQILPPTKIRDVRPGYAERLAGVTGMVILDARIGVDGKVGSVEVLSSVHPDLEDAAIAAVSQWEFTPTLLNCAPVEVRMLVSVTFASRQ